MDSEFLLVALGCGQFTAALQVAAKQPLVVYGTMHGAALRLFIERLAPDQSRGCSVYFYETG